MYIKWMTTSHIYIVIGHLTLFKDFTENFINVNK